MAGNYPDAPSNRMLMDRDGTQMYRISGTNVLTQLTSGQIQSVCNEDSKGNGAPFQLTGQNEAPAYLMVFFPERRDVAGYYFNTGLGGNATLLSAEVSTNTTNGVDGSWSSISSAGYPEAMSPNYRTHITTITALGIRAMRFRCNSPASSYGCYPSVHVFGNPAAGQNPNRLSIWHPTSDAHIAGAYFDWGDTPRNSSADRTCRVKNLSSTLTAQAITVAFDALTNTTPSVPGQFLVSEDGTTFGATADIGDLSPGGISPVLTVRRNTPANAALSVWEPRIIAQASSWS